MADEESRTSPAGTDDDVPVGSLVSLRPLAAIRTPLLRDDVERERRQRFMQLGIGAGVLTAVAIGAFALGRMSAAPSRPRVETPTESTPDTSLAVPLHIGMAPDAGIDDEIEPAVLAAEAPVVVPEPVVAPSVEPVAVPATPPPTGAPTRTTHTFGTARGFGPALNHAGLSTAEADRVIAALNGVMDFRRCRADHQIIVERGGDRTLTRVEYRASITQIYEARLGPDGAMHGSEVEVPVEHIRLARGGVVQTSLGNALEAAGLGRTLVGTFVEVFDGRIDFNTETRAGDTFRIIVDEDRIESQFLRYGTTYAVEYRSQRRGLLQAFWYAPRADLADFYDESGRAVHGGWLRTPLRYDHVSSPFNPRRMHPVLHRIMPHNGIDFAAGTGTPVWAAAEGVVTFVGPRGPNGNLISLRHDGGYESFYCHLSRFATGLHTGQTVHQRDVIGYVGNTGRSTAPHLHFGLKRRGAFVDPAHELNGPGRMLPGANLGRFRAELPRMRADLDAVALPSTPATPTTPAAPTSATPSEEAFD